MRASPHSAIRSPQSTILDPHALATARSHTYTLFAQLYLDGLTPELWPYVQALPDLAQTAPERYDADEAAAAHQHLFGFNVFAYESIFLTPSSTLGGEISASVRQFYDRVAFPWQDPAAIPDHLSMELRLTSWLCGAEADAWEDGNEDQAQRMQRLQCEFLDAHLLAWLPAAVQAIRQQQTPFYAALASLTLDLALDHRTAHSAIPDSPSQILFPPLPALLDNARTGLKEIAAYLLTPAHSGFYLSRDDVSRLARRRELPAGFGDRKHMLAELLRAAASYEQLLPLLGDLQALASEWQDMYDGLSPGLPVAATWQERLANTQALLQRLGMQ